MSDNLLSLSGVAKAFGERVILDDVTWGLDAGRRVGLIGDNGAGKSTLLKILAGREPADGGVVALRGGVRVAMLDQTPTFPEGATARSVLEGVFAPVQALVARYEEAAAALSPDAEGLLAEIERRDGWGWPVRVDRAVTALGLGELDRPVAPLSGGEKKRLALARLLLEDADLVLLDEPTNHLDTETVEWLETWVREESKATFVIVTHDRYFLDAVVDTIVEVRGGALRTYRGGYTDYLAARAEEEALRGRTLKRRQQVLAAELEWARRSPKARTSKSRSRLKAVEERRREVEALGQVQARARIQFGAAPRLGKTILELHHVTKGFGGRPLVRDLSLLLRRGERFGILGPNGAGKTTLLRLILGELEPDAGRIVLGANTRVAYFDQHRRALDPARTVRQTVTPDGGDWVFPGGGERVHVVSWLDRFAFPASTHGMRVGSLSGGEQNRLAIARFLLQPANLLLLDEPTNDLDILTLSLFEAALLEFEGCVLAVSHDRYFLDKVATGILAFEEAAVVAARARAGLPSVPEAAEQDVGSVAVVMGDYTNYRRLHLERVEAAKRAAREAQRGNAARRAPAGSPAPRRAGLSYRERQELEGLEERVEAAEARVEALESQLAQPDVWAADAGARGRALQAELDAARAEAEELVERWTELMEKAEEP